MSYEPGKKLRIWLLKEGITLTHFGKLVGLTRVSVSRICAGSRYPSRLVAYKIEKATRGEVTADELLRPKD